MPCNRSSVRGLLEGRGQPEAVLQWGHEADGQADRMDKTNREQESKSELERDKGEERMNKME